MESNVAVIDLGSNTFHILICGVGGGRFREIFRQRFFVGLAEGGISVIKQAPLRRASEAFLAFKKTLETHAVTDVRIIGTAALRSASNANLIQDQCLSILGQPIEIIAGEREAELIYKGVSQLVDCSIGDHMIMDIGGGSTEFIIIRDGEAKWSKSYNIGVAVLHEMFHKSEPISNIEVSNMSAFLDDTLADLREMASNFDFQNLVGASGSFEVVVTLNNGKLLGHEVNTYKPKDFSSIEQQVIASTFAERAAMDGMPESRIKLIVVAFLLIRYTLDLINPEQIVVSPYALKEGVISELI